MGNFIATTAHKFWVMWYILKTCFKIVVFDMRLNQPGSEDINTPILTCFKLLVRGVRHDISKYLNPEEPYFKKYQPLLKQCEYGSDEYKGHLRALTFALKHHYAVNDHHPEHFDNGFSGMSDLAVVEMICDWKAATKRHKKGCIISSIEYNSERFGLTDLQSGHLRSLVDKIGLI